MKRKTYQDQNQIDLFAGTDFAPEVVATKQRIEKIRSEKRADITLSDTNDLVLWFAKHCKQSLAFLDCVLSGKLPGDYHGSKLWIRRFGNSWTNEIIEDRDYWISKGWKVIDSKETICITLHNKW